MGLFDFFSSSSLSSDESTILARIKPVIADFLVVDTSEIRPETTLDELGCDELDCVELFIAFAEQLNYHTPPKVEKTCPYCQGHHSHHQEVQLIP